VLVADLDEPVHEASERREERPLFLQGPPNRGAGRFEGRLTNAAEQASSLGKWR